MMGTEATVGEAGDPTVIPGLDIKTIQSSDFCEPNGHAARKPALF